MRLGIDASNLRDGGGVTHLISILAAADPPAHGIPEVVVWGSRETLSGLTRAPWLKLSEQRALEGGLPRRLMWRRFMLPALARGRVDLLWLPGGNAAGVPRPFATMCRNMLPFEPRERARYGLSWMRLRLTLLGHAQARTFRRANGVIFLTSYARDAVTGRVGTLEGDVETIPHGVAERFRRAPRPQRPATSFTEADPFRIAAISVIDVYKHQGVLAEAVAALRSKGHPIALDLVGAAYPPAYRKLRRVLDRVDPAGKAIRYVGRVPFTTLHEQYHAADAFAFGSSCENLPNILLEAMAAGLPIACSDRGPMPEVLGGGGVYFDPEHAPSVADALERLFLDDELRTRCAAEAFDRASRFTWKRCAEQTMDFLARVGAGAGAPR